MVESDTIKLLRECDAGVQMGITSIEDVLKYVKNETLRNKLYTCKEKHGKLQDEIQMLLQEYHDRGKAPNALAQGMSWMKTNVKLSINESDETIADLVVDGCNMGIKSVCRYMNQYSTAMEGIKALCYDLIELEENFAKDLRKFL